MTIVILKLPQAQVQARSTVVSLREILDAILTELGDPIVTQYGYDLITEG